MSNSPAPPTLALDHLRALTSDPWQPPGSGDTARRWAVLAALSADDLPLAKLVEPHHDAAAILHDLGGTAILPGEVWAVWAAEPPFAVLSAVETERGWTLTGLKAFCSGAALVTHALVTADTERGSRLFAIRLSSPGITVSDEAPTWAGQGMSRAGTVTLAFVDVVGQPVGAAGAYVDRTGFWLGAIGVAVCWLGGTRGVGATLERASATLDAHGRAHLGAVRAALDTSDLAFEAAAGLVDRQHLSTDQARRLALSLRSHVADVVASVIGHVGDALGPGPLAFDAGHAARVADLQVFVRQHHAERDLEALGRMGAPDA